MRSEDDERSAPMHFGTHKRCACGAGNHWANGRPSPRSLARSAPAMRVCYVLCVAFALAILMGPPLTAQGDTITHDIHSYANSAQVRVTHVDLDLNVDFAAKTIRGT